MASDPATAREHVLEFAASAMARNDWAAAEAWCTIAWMMGGDEREPRERD